MHTTQAERSYFTNGRENDEGPPAAGATGPGPH